VHGPRGATDGVHNASSAILFVHRTASRTSSHIPTTSTHTMATSRDAPNPLRPYYIPPSIGLPADVPQNQTAAAPYSARVSNSSSSKPSLGSQARDMLSDLDYDSYFPETSPTVAGHAKRLLDQALWNYTSVLLAQPFEVAKTILQIHEASGQLPSLGKLKTEDWGSKSRPDSFHSGKYEDVGMSRLDM
jgi:fusion and transport protein UGO1